MGGQPHSWKERAENKGESYRSLSLPVSSATADDASRSGILETVSQISEESCRNAKTVMVESAAGKLEGE